jgi:hypothetical protein
MAFGAITPPDPQIGVAELGRGGSTATVERMVRLIEILPGLATPHFQVSARVADRDVPASPEAQVRCLLRPVQAMLD